MLACHAILSAYGFWLPNDERGSWSDFVGSYELHHFGPATKVDTRQSLARRPFDRHRRDRMKRTLKYPPVVFTGEQARAVARGFADYARRSALVIHACAVLPEHVHLVFVPHHLAIERTIEQLKVAATRQLNEEDLHPLTHERERHGRPPTPWARGQWTVYLNKPAEVRRAIRYVENNPLKEGKPRQHWSFVTPFEL
ncbi:MAG: transposase [Phycisphaeraceae bacterium]